MQQLLLAALQGQQQHHHHQLDEQLWVMPAGAEGAGMQTQQLPPPAPPPLQPPAPIYDHSTICMFSGSEDEAVAVLVIKLLEQFCPSQAPALMQAWGLGPAASPLLALLGPPEPLIPPGKPRFDLSPIFSRPAENLLFLQVPSGRGNRKADKGVLKGFKPVMSGHNTFAPARIGKSPLFQLQRSGHVPYGSAPG